MTLWQHKQLELVNGDMANDLTKQQENKNQNDFQH